MGRSDLSGNWMLTLAGVILALPTDFGKAMTSLRAQSVPGKGACWEPLPLITVLFLANCAAGHRRNGHSFRAAHGAWLPRCAVPECHGISHADPIFREALWDRFFTAAPRPRTPSELLYSDRRLRSKSSPAATIL